MKTSTINHWEKKIELAISLSHNDPKGKLDLKTVAEMVQESTDNFSHKFAAICGEPFMQFSKRRRLEAGAGYLRHSDYSIGLISEQCGYSNVGNFTKAFGELYNDSPKAFRAKMYLPNETHTLQRTKNIAPQNELQHPIFTPDRTEDLYLPDYNLYYHILPKNMDPVKGMITDVHVYQQRLSAIKISLALPEAMIITGTLDIVPVTSYVKMRMYVGLLVPINSVHQMAHAKIKLCFQTPYNLYTKHLPGGYYKKLPVPMSFAAAGLPMYEFINNCCRSGYFKMSGNHFFISLTGLDECEIFIPWSKK